MPAAASATPVVTAARLRLGRLLLQNAFGSDQLDLSMPLLAQYYATVGAFTGFVTNTDDSLHHAGQEQRQPGQLPGQPE